MTETEWLTSNDPWSLLQVVERSRPAERKVRLLNAAICRRFWDYLPEASKAILVESELIADGLEECVDDMELCWRANAVVGTIDRGYLTKWFPSAKVRRDAAAAVCYAVIPNELWGAVGYFWALDPKEKGPHSTIIRDVFGDLFRPAAPMNPSLLMPHILALARDMYDSRAFERMPELGKALREAGCTNEEILGHCEQEGLHCRGCWLVDVLLGKK